MTAITETTQINKVTDKSGTFLGYSVSSHSGGDAHYMTWDAERTCWQCSCKAGQHHQKCHAVKALDSMLLAQHTAEKPATTSIATKGVLNNRNQGFSLMR